MESEPPAHVSDATLKFLFSAVLFECCATPPISSCYELTIENEYHSVK